MSGTFVSVSADRASRNYAIAYGEIRVADPQPGHGFFCGLMTVLTFAWLDSKDVPRHTPIIHSFN